MRYLIAGLVLLIGGCVSDSGYYDDPRPRTHLRAVGDCMSESRIGTMSYATCMSYREQGLPLPVVPRQSRSTNCHTTFDGNTAHTTCY